MRFAVLGAALVAALPALAGDATFPAGVDWQAASLGKTSFANEALPTLTVNGGQVSGSTGCNRYTGAMTTAGARLSLGPMAITKMFCHGPGGDNERLFVGALASARSWAMEGKTLVIETGQGTLRFTRK